jgi:hypothetical protein
VAGAPLRKDIDRRQGKDKRQSIKKCANGIRTAAQEDLIKDKAKQKTTKKGA